MGPFLKNRSQSREHDLKILIGDWTLSDDIKKQIEYILQIFLKEEITKKLKNNIFQDLCRYFFKKERGENFGILN